jgi:hypothetical protein
LRSATAPEEAKEYQVSPFFNMVGEHGLRMARLLGKSTPLFM